MPIHRSANSPVRIFCDESLSLAAKGLYATIIFEFNGEIDTEKMLASWVEPLDELIEAGYIFTGGIE